MAELQLLDELGPRDVAEQDVDSPLAGPAVTLSTSLSTAR